MKISEELRPHAEEPESGVRGVRLGALKARNAASVEHVQVTDQVLQARAIAGSGDNNVRLQPPFVAEDDIFVLKARYSRNHGNLSGLQSGDKSIVDRGGYTLLRQSRCRSDGTAWQTETPQITEGDMLCHRQQMVDQPGWKPTHHAGKTLHRNPQKPGRNNGGSGAHRKPKLPCSHAHKMVQHINARVSAADHEDAAVAIVFDIAEIGGVYQPAGEL